MEPEGIVRALGARLNRRRLLGRVTLAAVGGLASVLGYAKGAEALYYIQCCELCLYPFGGCGSCACMWCWYCCDARSNYDTYQCCECYSSGGSCAGNCNGVVRSCLYSTPYQCRVPQPLAP